MKKSTSDRVKGKGCEEGGGGILSKQDHCAKENATDSKFETPACDKPQFQVSLLFTENVRNTQPWTLFLLPQLTRANRTCNEFKRPPHAFTKSISATFFRQLRLNTPTTTCYIFPSNPYALAKSQWLEKENDEARRSTMTFRKAKAMSETP